MNELQSFLGGELGFIIERLIRDKVPVTGRIEWMPALSLGEKVDWRMGYKLSWLGAFADDDQGDWDGKRGGVWKSGLHTTMEVFAREGARSD